MLRADLLWWGPSVLGLFCTGVISLLFLCRLVNQPREPSPKASLMVLHTLRFSTSQTISYFFFIKYPPSSMLLFLQKGTDTYHKREWVIQVPQNQCENEIIWRSRNLTHLGGKWYPIFTWLQNIYPFCLWRWNVRMKVSIGQINQSTFDFVCNFYWNYFSSLWDN